VPSTRTRPSPHGHSRLYLCPCSWIRQPLSINCSIALRTCGSLWSLSGTGPQGIHGAERIRSYARSPTAAVAGISPGLAEEVQRVVWELAGVSPDELGALVRLADLRHPDPGAGGKEDGHPRFLGAAEHRACRPQLLRVEFDTQPLADLPDRGRRGGLPEVYVPSGQAELAAGSA
jgi:hypothetical protein